MKEMVGWITQIQRFSINDGPGIRTTIFFKGCSLSCPWCHNPETKIKTPEIFFRLAKCVRCNACFDVCEEKAITLETDVRIQRGQCTSCMKCVKACKTGAISVVGKQSTVSEILEEVWRDNIFYRTSQGGVTFSGGEPLVQPEFLLALAKAAKESGLHTALDTAGYASWQHFEPILPYVDLLLYDIKHIAVTPQSPALVFQNIEKAAQLVQTRFRVAVIPGYNDAIDIFKQIVDLGLRLKIAGLDIFPYHRFGEQKYRYLDKEYSGKDLSPLSDELVCNLMKISKAAGLDTTIGG